MKTYIFKPLMVLSLICGALFLGSCSDDDIDNVPDRLFRPVNIKGVTILNQVDLEWSSIPYSTSYTVEYTTDKDFLVGIKSFTNETNKVTITGLEFYTDYYFRITAHTNENGIEDSKPSNVSDAIRTKTAPALVTVDDFGDDYFTISWVKNEEVTLGKIVIEASDGSLYEEIEITEDNQSGNVTFDTLEPVLYTITSYTDTGIKLSDLFVNLLAPLYNVDDEDIYPESVILRWDASKNFNITKIEVSEVDGDQEQSIPITDITAGNITVNGLTPVTWYTATIYVDDEVANSIIFRTWHQIPAGAINISDGEDLADAIDQAADGATIILGSGEYVLDGYTYSKAITLMTASPADNAVVTVNSSGTINGNLDFLRFIGLTITGKADKTDYFINHPNNALWERIGEFYVADCKLTKFRRSFLRNQQNNAAYFGTLEVATFDNCIVEDLFQTGDNYAFIHWHHTTGGTPGKINFLNTTFNKAHTLVTIAQGAAANPTECDIIIDKCTFYQMVSGGGNRSIVNATNNLGNVKLTIKNSIFGPQLSGANLRGGEAVADVTTVNSWRTSDFAFQTNSAVTTPELSLFDGSSDDLFADPENGDFTLKDQAMIDAQVGDPRWR